MSQQVTANSLDVYGKLNRRAMQFMTDDDAMNFLGDTGPIGDPGVARMLRAKDEADWDAAALAHKIAVKRKRSNAPAAERQAHLSWMDRPVGDVGRGWDPSVPPYRNPYVPTRDVDDYDPEDEEDRRRSLPRAKRLDQMSDDAPSNQARAFTQQCFAAAFDFGTPNRTYLSHQFGEEAVPKKKRCPPLQFMAWPVDGNDWHQDLADTHQRTSGVTSAISNAYDSHFANVPEGGNLSLEHNPGWQGRPPESGVYGTSHFVPINLHPELPAVALQIRKDGGLPHGTIRRSGAAYYDAENKRVIIEYEAHPAANIAHTMDQIHHTLVHELVHHGQHANRPGMFNDYPEAELRTPEDWLANVTHPTEVEAHLLALHSDARRTGQPLGQLINSFAARLAKASSSEDVGRKFHAALTQLATKHRLL